MIVVFPPLLVGARLVTQACGTLPFYDHARLTASRASSSCDEGRESLEFRPSRVAPWSNSVSRRRPWGQPVREAVCDRFIISRQIAQAFPAAVAARGNAGHDLRLVSDARTARLAPPGAIGRCARLAEKQHPSQQLRVHAGLGLVLGSCSQFGGVIYGAVKRAFAEQGQDSLSVHGSPQQSPVPRWAAWSREASKGFALMLPDVQQLSATWPVAISRLPTAKHKS